LECTFVTFVRSTRLHCRQPQLIKPGPVSFGGQAEDAFDEVVPDLPGYDFSDKPKKLGMIFHVNDLWARLMTDMLGYKKFGAPCRDWGSTVTEQLVRSHPDFVVAIHLTENQKLAVSCRTRQRGGRGFESRRSHRSHPDALV
jgi:pimeloyl-ACP methyl ester carboxylesterase